MDVKPEQPLPLDINIRQKQVARILILTSSSLEVTGENYSRSDFAVNGVHMDLLQSDRLIASTDVDERKPE